MTRLLVLSLSLVFIAGLASLTVAAIVEQGLTGEAVISILILVVLGFGIAGALFGRPRDPPS
jgi:hypothetical protein